jgi:hypothetical protein
MESSGVTLAQSIMLGWLCISPVVVIGLAVFLYRQFKRIRSLKSELQTVETRLREAERDGEYTARQEWLQELSNLSFANEVEVEIKFVYPLLLFLGYQDSDFSVRYKVPIQAGREQLQKEADWVIWQKNGNAAKAALVIEAKAPAQPIDILVQNQGRSYAFALNAPRYILTNGVHFLVYQRGVEADRCAFQCSINDLPGRWPELVSLIGAP